MAPSRTEASPARQLRAEPQQRQQDRTVRRAWRSPPTGKGRTTCGKGEELRGGYGHPDQTTPRTVHSGRRGDESVVDRDGAAVQVHDPPGDCHDETAAT